jgi:hypothetical protein
MFGFHLVTDDGTEVGTLRVDSNEESGRSFVVDVKGIESIVKTAVEAQEKLAAHGFQLDDLTDAEKVARFAGRYGVVVSRDPDESARFRVRFVNGPRAGEVVEVDVRTDGVKADKIPDDWYTMVAAVSEASDYMPTPGNVEVPVEMLMDMLRNARQAGRHWPAKKPDASTQIVHRDLVDNMLADLGLYWHGEEED